MNPVITILKKELKRIFTDTRILLSIFLPGVLMFFTYSVMGSFMKDAISGSDIKNTTYQIAYSDNNTAIDTKPYVLLAFDVYLSASETEKTNRAEYTVLQATKLEENKAKVKGGTYDVYIHFSDAFDEKVANSSYTQPKSHIDLYYNGSKESAAHVYHLLTSMVDASYKNYLINIDGSSQPITPNVSDKNAETAKAMAVFMPMMAIMVCFSAVLTLTPDTVAGEKERGTMAAMLLAPIKRSSIVVGKMLSTLLVAILGGVSSFVGMLFGLSRMGMDLFTTTDFGGIIVLALLIITVTIMFVSVGLLISTLTKSPREATSYMSPIMILAIVASLLSGTLAPYGIVMAFVPIVNVSICFYQLVAYSSVDLIFMLISVGFNVIISAIVLFIVSLLFKKESLMLK